MKTSVGLGLGRKKKNCDVHPTEPQPIWWGALERLLSFIGSCGPVLVRNSWVLFHSVNSISVTGRMQAGARHLSAAELNTEQLLTGSCLLTPLSTPSNQSSLEGGVSGISHVHQTCQCKSSVILLTYLSCWENGPCSCIEYMQFKGGKKSWYLFLFSGKLS